MIEVYEPAKRGDFLDREEIEDALEADAIFCDCCHEPIYLGDSYYKIRTHENWCWRCIQDAHRTHWGR